MGNRNYQQFQGTMERGVVKLFAKVTFGESGAPTLDKAASRGIRSVARTDTGDYTFTFGTATPPGTDAYARLLNAQATPVFSTDGSTEALVLTVADSDVTGGELDVTFVLASSGAEADPDAAEVAFFEFTLATTDRY